MIVNQRSLYYLRILSDLILLTTAFIIAAVSAQSVQILLLRNHMFFLLIGLNILWIFTSNLISFYDDLNSRYFAFQFSSILKNSLVQLIASVLFIFATKEDLFTRNFILYYFILLTLLITLRYIAFRKILKALRKKGKNIRNLLIIGAGTTGLNFYNVLKDHPDFGYRFVGFLKERPEPDNNKDILGSLDDLEPVIQKFKVEEAVIALSGNSPEVLEKIIKTCNRNAVKTHIIPDYFRYVSKRFQVSMLGDFPIITVRTEPLDEVQWKFVKRTFDIIFSSLVIILVLWWIIPLIGLLIKLQSAGPAIFTQERIGVRNRKFRCYKFRTMYADTESQNIVAAVVKEDPRITSVGRILRRTNIDELPQFFNVFKGEMSVVGPRPHAVPYDKKYGTIVDEIKMRHNVKPGITGWAQIHGLRGDVTDEEENTRRTVSRIEYDLWYIENWTFWLDIQIILLTVWQMLSGKSRGV